MIDKFVSIALSQIGVHEEGGNNMGAAIEKYKLATWLKPSAFSWCAALVCWVLMEWLNSDPAFLVELNITNAEAWRCKDASAFGWIKWAKQKGLKVYEFIDGIPTVLVQKGDIIVYSFSHIGIAEKYQAKIGDRISTVEGNTNLNGTRDSLTGDGVLQKSRAPKQIKAIIRLEKA